MSDFEDDTPTGRLGPKSRGSARNRCSSKAAGQRRSLAFANLDKEMVLNSTNINVLVDALGKRPADWIGAEVGIYTEPTMFGGKTMACAFAYSTSRRLCRRRSPSHPAFTQAGRAGGSTLAGPSRRSRPGV
jgi:hypothetical protein